MASGLLECDTVISYGARGAPVPGSKYVRDYCTGCHDPIRVKSIMGHNFCTRCTLRDPNEQNFGKARSELVYELNLPDGVLEIF